MPDYKKDWREIDIYKVVYNFYYTNTSPTTGENIITKKIKTMYVLELDMARAIKECKKAYCRNDRVNIDVSSVEKIGSPVGLHRFVL